MAATFAGKFVDPTVRVRRPLQGLEITLRNKMSAAIAPAWYDHSSLGLRYAQAQQIQRAKDALHQSGKPLDPPRVVAELNFGFWVGLLSSKYENNLWFVVPRSHRDLAERRLADLAS